MTFWMFMAAGVGFVGLGTLGTLNLYDFLFERRKWYNLVAAICCFLSACWLLALALEIGWEI